MDYTKPWVRVDHNNRQAIMFENDGRPFTKTGAYMSLEYFKQLQTQMPLVCNYEMIYR